jgi:hypothetical protein
MLGEETIRGYHDSLMSYLRSHSTNHLVSLLAALRINYLDSATVQATRQGMSLKPAVEDDRDLMSLEPVIAP